LSNKTAPRQNGFYKFYAIFNQTADADQPDESPVIPAATTEISEQIKKTSARIEELNKRLEREAATPAMAAALAKWESSRTPDPANAAARKDIPKEILAILDTPPARRTNEQVQQLARHFRSIVLELKPIRDEIAQLEKDRPIHPPSPTLGKNLPKPPILSKENA